jgi:hypothetical protein
VPISSKRVHVAIGFYRVKGMGSVGRFVNLGDPSALQLFRSHLQGSILVVIRGSWSHSKNVKMLTEF